MSRHEPQIDIGPLREAVRAKWLGGESMCRMARDAGYMETRPDIERLRRMVGLAASTGKDGRRKVKSTIGRGLAEELAAALDIDPREIE